MGLTKGDQVQELMELLLQRVPEALTAIAASGEGLSIAAAKKALTSLDEDSLAVAATQIIEMSGQINSRLEQGHLGRVLIEGSQRTTVVTNAGRDLVLIVVVPADAKLGLAMMTIGQIAQSVAQVYD